MLSPKKVKYRKMQKGKMAAKLVFRRGLPSELLLELNQKIRARPELQEMTSNLELLCAQIHELFKEYKDCHAEVPWNRAKISSPSEHRTQNVGQANFSPGVSNFSRASSSSIRGDRGRGSWNQIGRGGRGGRENWNPDFGRNESGDVRNDGNWRGGRTDRQFGSGRVSPGFRNPNSPTPAPTSASTPASGRPRLCFSCGKDGHFAHNCPKIRESEDNSKGPKPNFSRGSLKSAEIHEGNETEQSGFSHLSNGSEQNEEGFSEEHSEYFSHDDDENFQPSDSNESNQSANTFKGPIPNTPLKD